MGTLEEKMKKTIKKFNLIEPGDKLVVGVSGGPDSIAMLNALYELKAPFIVVAHINHQILE